MTLMPEPEVRTCNRGHPLPPTTTWCKVCDGGAEDPQPLRQREHVVSSHRHEIHTSDEESLWPVVRVMQRELHGVRNDDGEVVINERSEALARKWIEDNGEGEYVHAWETTTVTRTPWEDQW